MHVNWFVGTARHLVERRFSARLRKHVHRALGLTRTWYIAPEVGSRAALLAKLREKLVSFVLVDELAPPSSSSANPPLTFLFADSDARAVASLLTKWPIGEEVLPYSASGVSDFSLSGTPALPPAVASLVLSEALLSAGDPRPTDLHAALLYLFRLVYLDGYGSGIVSEHRAAAQSSSEVVARVHQKLEHAGLQAPVPLTLESLDALMQVHGFRPPLEMLERLAHRNRWIEDMLTRLGEWKTVEPAGWVVFYIREKVVEAGKVDLLIRSLRREGFIFPDVPQPDADQMRKLTAEVRGGNWGRGPFPQSGGEPVMVIVGFDPHPLPIESALLQEHPMLDNARIHKAKKAVRKVLHKGLRRHERYNGFHSTDNSLQAWRAIRSMYPHLEAALREAIRAR